MLTQIVRWLTERMDFSAGRRVAHYRHRLLLLIDGFPLQGTAFLSGGPS